VDYDINTVVLNEMKERIISFLLLYDVEVVLYNTESYDAVFRMHPQYSKKVRCIHFRLFLILPSVTEHW